MNLIVAIIVLAVVGAVFYGIYHQIGKAFPGVPQVIAAIVLLLVFLLIALEVFGVTKATGLPRVSRHEVQYKDLGRHYYTVRMACQPLRPDKKVAILYKTSSSI